MSKFTKNALLSFFLSARFQPILTRKKEKNVNKQPKQTQKNSQWCSKKYSTEFKQSDQLTAHHHSWTRTAPTLDSTSALWSFCRSRAAALVSSLRAAMCRAGSRTLPFVSFSSSRETTWSWPCWRATARGVKPSCAWREREKLWKMNGGGVRGKKWCEQMRDDRVKHITLKDKSPEHDRWK